MRISDWSSDVCSSDLHALFSFQRCAIDCTRQEYCYTPPITAPRRSTGQQGIRKMSKARKQLTLLVTVSVPVDMSAVQARREVRTLLSEQCKWGTQPEDVKAVSVKPIPRAQEIGSASGRKRGGTYV